MNTARPEARTQSLSASSAQPDDAAERAGAALMVLWRLVLVAIAGSFVVLNWNNPHSGSHLALLLLFVAGVGAALLLGTTPPRAVTLIPVIAIALCAGVMIGEQTWSGLWLVCPIALASLPIAYRR
ncbi:hypothetical protein [Gephyromycinifex aptenodytis]|uniref:hypothetical protein n=1 Tax=Gephyromycinifex aptenodytis TaxID=2716227 RepID=UPI001447F886|nr:hypothetical protein [Gephyromycinifex aptenodytis]